MQCEICKQREATVHIKEFKDGKCENHHFCIECAKAQEQQGPLSALGFNISDLLFKTVSGLEKKSGAAQNAAGESAPATPLTRCPVCNWSLKKIRKNNGKVGCPECYNIFSEVLRDALARIQKGTVHRGKHPVVPDGKVSFLWKIRSPHYRNSLLILSPVKNMKTPHCAVTVSPHSNNSLKRRINEKRQSRHPVVPSGKFSGQFRSQR